MCVSPFQEHKKVRVPAKGCMPWSIHYSSGPTIYSKPFMYNKNGSNKNNILGKHLFFSRFCFGGKSLLFQSTYSKTMFFLKQPQHLLVASSGRQRPSRQRLAQRCSWCRCRRCSTFGGRVAKRDHGFGNRYFFTKSNIHVYTYIIYCNICMCMYIYLYIYNLHILNAQCTVYHLQLSAHCALIDLRITCLVQILVLVTVYPTGTMCIDYKSCCLSKHIHIQFAHICTQLAHIANTHLLPLALHNL